MRGLVALTIAWVWICLTGFCALWAASRLGADPKWGSVLLGLLFLQFVCWALGILGAAAVVVGWIVFLAWRLMRREPRQWSKKVPVPFYHRDPEGWNDAVKLNTPEI